MSTQASDTVMEARAQARFVRVTPQKARRVVDLIRGKSVPDAVATMRFAPQTASEPVLKVLDSAVANARVQADRTAQAFDERMLVVTAAYVDEGPTMKRFRPRAQGRASRILKRTSHITVMVGQLATTPASARTSTARTSTARTSTARTSTARTTASTTRAKGGTR